MSSICGLRSLTVPSGYLGKRTEIQMQCHNFLWKFYFPLNIYAERDREKRKSSYFVESYVNKSNWQRNDNTNHEFRNNIIYFFFSCSYIIHIECKLQETNWKKNCTLFLSLLNHIRRRQHHYNLIRFDWCNFFRCNGFLLHYRVPLIDCFVCICKGFVPFAVASVYMWSTHNQYYQRNVSTLPFCILFTTLFGIHFRFQSIWNFILNCFYSYDVDSFLNKLLCVIFISVSSIKSH